MSTETLEVLNYTVRVDGVFGRNRKRKVEFFKVWEVRVDKPLSDAEMLALLDAEVAAQKVKPGAIVEISATPQTLERQFDDDTGELVVTWRKTVIRLGGERPHTLRRVIQK